MKPKCLLILSPIVAVTLMLAANATAAPIEFVANLTGAKEVPPNASPGTGSATALFDLASHSLELHVIFSGLTTPTIAAHIHAPTAFRFAGTAGVATQVPSFIGFPLGVTSGTFDNTFDTSDASFIIPPLLPPMAERWRVRKLPSLRLWPMAGPTSIFIRRISRAEKFAGFCHTPDASSTIACLGIGLIGLGMFRRKFGTRLNA